MRLMEKLHRCELCRIQATLYCEADSAYLCVECDGKVHGANFLVARHARNILCCRCYQTSEKCVRGGRPVLPAKFLCEPCAASSEGKERTSFCISSAESAIPGRPAPGESSCEESRREFEEAEVQRRIILGEEEASANRQSPCADGGAAVDGRVSEVSIDGWSYGDEGTSSRRTAKNFLETPGEVLPEDGGGLLSSRRRRGAAQNAEMKAEAILRNWYGHLKLGSPSTVPLAMYLMEKAKSLCKARPVPVVDGQKARISLATSLWLAATLCENPAQLPPVKKLQECSGIPCKLIIKSGSRLCNLLNWRRQEEGWAECST